MAFLEGLLGGGDPYALYGDLLTDKQRAALRDQQMGQGLLRMAGAFAEAAKPSLLPTGGIGSALGRAAGALAGHEDEGLKGIANAQKLKQMQQELAWQQKLLPELTEFYRRKNGGLPPGPSTAGPSVGPNAPPPAPGPSPAPPTAPGPDDNDLARLWGIPGDTPNALPPGAKWSGLLPSPEQQFAGMPGFQNASYGGAPNGGPPFRLAAAASSSPGAAGGGGQGAGLSGSAWEIANNNFGGMRKPGVNAGPSQGGFQSFATPEEGLAKIGWQLDRYASGATTGKPLNTVRQIVSTWAPPHENNTPLLINRAARIVGVDPDAVIDVSNPAIKAKLIEATIRNEQGGRLPVDPEMIGAVASNPSLARYAGASFRGERPADIVLPSDGGDGGGQLQALQALMQMFKSPGDTADEGGSDSLSALAQLTGGGSGGGGSSGGPDIVLPSSPGGLRATPASYNGTAAAGDDWLLQNAPFPTLRRPDTPPIQMTNELPKVPLGQAPGDFLPGGGPGAPATNLDTVIPSGRGLPASMLRQVQHNPGGGTNSLATPPGVGAALATPQGGVIAGTDKTPEQVAALNAALKMLNMKSPLSDLLETYYKSPGYLGEVARTEAEQRKLIEKQYDPLLEAEKTRKRMEVETELKPKLEAAVATAMNGPLKERAQAQADIDRYTEQLKQAGVAGTNVQEATVWGDDGKTKLTQKMTALEFAARQNDANKRRAKGDTTPRPGDIVGVSEEERAAEQARGKIGQEMRDVQVFTPTGTVTQSMTNAEIEARRKLASQRGGGPPQVGDIVDKPVMTQSDQKVADALGEDFITLRRQANAATKTIRDTHNLRASLDSGMFTGLDANVNLFLARLGDTLGWKNLSDPEKVKNTETYIANLGSEVLAMVKDLRPASNIDLQFAQGMVGGQNLSPASIRKLLDMREEYARLAIERHNEEAATRNPEIFKGTRREIPMPSPYQVREITTPSGNKATINR